jgi:ATP-binding protein involved in chromosome partitioning
LGKGGGEKEAQRQNMKLLGQIPLDPKLRELGDAGVPIVTAQPDSPAARAFAQIAEAVHTYFTEGVTSK